MHKYDKLWHNINSLLSHLRASNAVKIIDDYYQQYGNSAAAEIIDKQIKELQERLDAAI